MKKTRQVTKRPARRRARRGAPDAGEDRRRESAPKPVAGRVAKVSELKAGLSAYLARVKRGEEVVVTDRGRSVAKLVPIPPDEDPEMERMRDLERRGIVTIHGTGRIPPEFWDLPRLEDPEGLVLRGLLEDREEEDREH